MRILFYALLFLLLAQRVFSGENADCAKCHANETMQCSAPPKALHHKFANREVSDNLDSKVFSDRTFINGKTKYIFFKDRGAFKISVSEDGKNAEEFNVKFAIGLEPLVQYVVEGERGAMQVVPIAYDPLKDELFDVFGGETRNRGDWGHWLSKGMNWNSNCAYCHMTGFKKNYDAESDSYSSKFADHGVSCLQCHTALPKDCGQSGIPILEKRPSPSERMGACASCHSRREHLNAERFKVGDDYFDSFRPELPVVDGIYYADGKVRDEDFVFSSFMMCRQYTAGIVCTDCHDRHTMRTSRPIDKNQLCLTCHAPEARNIKGAPTIDPHKHSFHGDNEGNLCVNCHMPKTVYMGRDARYDHGLTSPDPVLTKVAGIPNACSQCHDKIDSDKPERDLDWLIESFEKNYGTERFLRKRARSIAVSKAHKGDVSEELKNELMRLLDLEENPAWQATIVALLSTWIGDDEVFDRIKKMLTSQHPLVRSSSIRAISARPDSSDILKEHLKDASAIVRIDSAFALGGELAENSSQYAELQEYLKFNSDRPLGLLKRADFALRSGKFAEAKSHAESALKLESGNPDLEREVAIMVFKAGYCNDSLKILKSAREKYPLSSQIAFALALFYSELGDLPAAANELESAVKLDENFARAWYNLSIARFKMGKIDEAIEAIDKAIETDPANAQQYTNLKNYLINNGKKR